MSTSISPSLGAALQGLQAAVETTPSPTSSSGWRWTLRQRVSAARDALMAETGAVPADGWLAARGGQAFRERNALLDRLGVLAQQALEAPDVKALRAEVARTLGDVRHHVQRAHDLAYDDVELELGGGD